jgi:uncharacterized protein YqeY
MTSTITIGRREIPPPSRPPGTVPAPQYAPPEGGLLAAAPGMARTDWIPTGFFSELDELRAEHERIYGLLREVGAEIRAIELQHKQEDSDHAEALRALARGERAEVPERTSSQERAVELAPLQERAKAARDVLYEFLPKAVAQIEERCDDWLAELDAKDAEIMREIEDAVRRLTGLLDGSGERQKLRTWLRRTAGRDPFFRRLSGRHIAFAALPTPRVNVDQIEALRERLINLTEEDSDA